MSFKVVSTKIKICLNLMSVEIEMENIIDDFSNDKRSNSSYTVSSEEHTSEEEKNINLLGSRGNDDEVFYNNQSQSDCDSRESSDLESSCLEKSYFTSLELDNKKKEEIIKLFYLFDVVILTDDYRIKLISSTGFYCFFKPKKYINPEEFPGILFMSFNSINLIKKSIRKHNDDLLNSESETCNKKFKYQICFDEGDIYKNMVYKKIQIKDKLLFVPMSKYQLKLTEYRLRGFCQIMEELGAIEIEIEFNNGTIEKSKKKAEVQSSEYTYIAGSLGFTASKEDKENKEITYKLIYPQHNTFILNAKVIKKKILNGKYIISKKNFDSNLELQYIIDSRCRHFITNYSTVFTLDNSISYDNKLIGKLEANKFNMGFETNSQSMKSLKLSINTKVKFCDQKNSYRNLLGDNVSWDSIGFNYLLGTLIDESFKEDGIFKIIFFVHKYIDKVIYYKNKSYYYQIKKIYKNMNKEFSFIEYRDLLLEHFTINSHWLHFLNFIDVLVFKSVSYDKLGLLVLMSQTDLLPYKKALKVINFIRHMSTKYDTEEQFWEMLEPNNYFIAIKKLDKEYDILNKFNWFNLEKLLHDLKKYKPKNSLINQKVNYNDLYQNFILGNRYSQFEKNIKPYLIKYINNHFEDKIKNIEPHLSGLIFNVIRPRHLIYYDINNEEKLKQLIENKILQIEEGQLLFNDIFDLVKDYGVDDIVNCDSDLYKNLFPLIQTEDFKNKYPYIYRKLCYILDDYSNSSKFVKFCSEHNMYKSTKAFCLNIIKKIIIIDYKFNIDNIDLNKLGFNILLENIKNRCKCKNDNEKELFFCNLCNFILRQNTNNLNENIISINIIDEELLQKIENCLDYNYIVDLACNFLNNKYNLNLETEFLHLLKI